MAQPIATSFQLKLDISNFESKQGTANTPVILTVNKNLSVKANAVNRIFCQNRLFFSGPRAIIVGEINNSER